MNIAHTYKDTCNVTETHMEMHAHADKQTHTHTHWEEAARPHAGTDGYLVLQREGNEPADARLAEWDLYNNHSHILITDDTKHQKLIYIKMLKGQNMKTLFFPGNISIS